MYRANPISDAALVSCVDVPTRISRGKALCKPCNYNSGLCGAQSAQSVKDVQFEATLRAALRSIWNVLQE